MVTHGSRLWKVIKIKTELTPTQRELIGIFFFFASIILGEAIAMYVFRNTTALFLLFAGLEVIFLMLALDINKTKVRLNEHN